MDMDKEEAEKIAERIGASRKKRRRLSIPAQ
jgi:hypothetical protein